MKTNLLFIFFISTTTFSSAQKTFQSSHKEAKLLQDKAFAPDPDSIFGEDSICVNQGYEYQCNSVDGHSVHWIVDNGSPTASSGSRIGVKWGAMGPRKIGAYLVKNSPPYCSGDTLWRNIYPKTAGVVAISGLNSVCPSTELSYTVNADVDAYVWNVNGGSIIHGQNSDSIVVLWDNNPGSAQITLVMTACVFYPPLTYPVTIINPPNLQITPDDPEYCLGENLNFTANFSSGSATSNYLWYENGSLSQNASSNSYSTSFSSTGTKAITVKCVNSVCQDSITLSQTFNIISPPKAHIGLQSGALDDCDSAGYFNATLFVTQESPGSYTNSWGGSTLTINTDSMVNCTVTDTISGCTSVSNTIRIQACDTSNSPGCITDITYEFRTTLSATCDSIIATGSPTHTSFLFFNDDSVTVPGSVPVFNAGYYTVTLLPSVCYPERDTLIEIPFVANFEYSFECNLTGDSLKTQFNDRSTFTTGAPTSWNWSINGGVWTSSSQNPSFNLPSDSCFSVTLSAGGCTKTKNICTPASPIANFNILSKTPVCEAFPVEFQDASSGFIISHLWNFDGTKYYGKRHGAMATFDFQAPAPHSEIITLTIEDMYGCEHSITKSFETKENNLDYEFFPTSIEACENDSVVLTPIQRSGMNPAHIDFLWITGDTSKSISLKTTGKYILSTVDSNLCIDNDPTNNIFRALFHPLPEVSIAGDIEICKLDMLDLLALGDTNLSFTWFDTIFTLGKSGRRFQRFYPYSGPNSVRLKAENLNTNCINEKSFNLLIHPEPDTPSISAIPNACMNDKVISLIGAHPNASNLQAQWSDGRRGFSIDTYERGSYWLSVTDSNGCSNTSLEEVLYRTEWCYFPCGCYEFCDDFPGGQPFLFWTGIPPDMADWRFIVNGFSDTVPPYAPPIVPFYYPDSFALDSHGVYNIQMVVESGNYCIDTSCTATITLVSCDSAGGGSLRQLPENGGSLIPYPNPSNMQLDLGLKYDLLGKGPWKLEIIGTGGQVLISKELQNKSGNESINLERYPPGVYQIRTTSLDGKRAYKKVILIQ